MSKADLGVRMVTASEYMEKYSEYDEDIRQAIQEHNLCILYEIPFPLYVTDDEAQKILPELKQWYDDFIREIRETKDIFLQ